MQWFLPLIVLESFPGMEFYAPPSVISEVFGTRQHSRNIINPTLEQNFYGWVIMKNKLEVYHVSLFGEHKWIPFLPTWYGVIYVLYKYD